MILSRNAERVPASVSGIDRAPVRLVACGDLAALVSTLKTPPSRKSIETIGQHDRATGMVVRGAITVAASRFGQMFPDDNALCGELATFAGRVVETLERYDGYGEMRVSLRDSMPGAGPQAWAPLSSGRSPGREYLESIREATMPRPPLDFRALLGELMREERVERRQDVYVISHLVRFADEEQYRIALYTHPSLLDAAITGPHALYAFAEPGQ